MSHNYRRTQKMKITLGNLLELSPNYSANIGYFIPSISEDRYITKYYWTSSPLFFSYLPWYSYHFVLSNFNFSFELSILVLFLDIDVPSRMAHLFNVCFWDDISRNPFFICHWKSSSLILIFFCWDGRHLPLLWTNQDQTTSAWI